jgi:hypothetical protein
MANETPLNKGEQVKGGPPIVENAQLPRMGGAKLPEKIINGAVVHMTMEAHPASGSNLMAPVPPHQIPQQGSEGNQTYQPQQRKPGEQQQTLSEGYIRLHVHVAKGQMSVIGAQAVSGPLVQPQSLQHDHAYEVTVSTTRVAAESIPDLTERRSYPNPHAGPGQEGHFITNADNYDFIVRISRKALSLAQLPQLRITLYQVSETAKFKSMDLQTLGAQFGQQVKEVAQLNGLRVEQLPAPVQESLRKALQ